MARHFIGQHSFLILLETDRLWLAKDGLRLRIFLLHFPSAEISGPFHSFCGGGHSTQGSMHPRQAITIDWVLIPIPNLLGHGTRRVIPRCSPKYKLYLCELSMCARVYHALHLSWVHCLSLTVATVSPHKVRGDKAKHQCLCPNVAQWNPRSFGLHPRSSLILQYRNCSCFPLSPQSSSDHSKRNPRALCPQCRQQTLSVALFALLGSYIYLYNEIWSLWPPFSSHPPSPVWVQSSDYRPVIHIPF